MRDPRQSFPWRETFLVSAARRPLSNSGPQAPIARRHEGPPGLHGMMSKKPLAGNQRGLRRVLQGMSVLLPGTAPGAAIALVRNREPFGRGARERRAGRRSLVMLIGTGIGPGIRPGIEISPILSKSERGCGLEEDCL